MMGIINGKYAKITSGDKKTIQKCKIIEVGRCMWCGCNLPRGSICIGKDWQKYCINCMNPLFEEINREIEEFKGIMEETYKDINTHKDEYEANNLASNI